MAATRAVGAAEGSVNALAITADGTRLMTAAADNLVKLWDTATGEMKQSLAGSTDALLTLAVRGDATQLAAAGADKQIYFWNVAAGVAAAGLGGCPGWVKLLLRATWCMPETLAARPAAGPRKRATVSGDRCG